ncbi:MAG: AsmA family protein, partial [Proteobacteria bacterium]|nr:AsmA family protein [Pseudomonadota bacterium]
MKKVLWGAGALILTLAALVLIAPNLVDWNSYKPEIAAQVHKYTGRDLTIGGAIGMKVFPKPTLIVGDVGFGNLPGGRTKDMVRLKSVEVRIALAPLLGGNIQVETVRLVEPKISLEVMADGRANWDIKPVGSSEAGTKKETSAPASVGAPAAAIAVDNF